MLFAELIKDCSPTLQCQRLVRYAVSDKMVEEAGQEIFLFYDEPAGN